MSHLSAEVCKRRKNLLSPFGSLSHDGCQQSTFVLGTSAMALFEEKHENCNDSIIYFLQRSLAVPNSWPLLVASIVVSCEEEFLITSKDFINCVEIMGHLNWHQTSFF